MSRLGDDSKSGPNVDISCVTSEILVTNSSDVFFCTYSNSLLINPKGQMRSLTPVFLGKGQ